MNSKEGFIPFSGLSYSAQESLARSKDFYNYMNLRRSVRDFSDKPVSKELIEHIIMTASSAPSGAHKQPWTFAAISNQELKKQIRAAAEEEERISYSGRMSEQWLKDLAPLGTDANKPFLEIAPWLIVAFKKSYSLSEEGEKHKNYYVNESVGLACGFLIAAIHHAGLITLTHTPSPMGFLSRILSRPENEKPFLLLPVGYPAEGAMIPDLERRPLEEVSVFYELEG